MTEDEYNDKKEEIKDIKKKISDLKKLKKEKNISDDDYNLKLMDYNDDEILIRIDLYDHELKEAAKFKKNKAEDLMQTIGTMQRYNTEVSKLRFNKHKAKRYLDKVYNEKYEYYRRGHGGIQLKTKGEYEVWIMKDSRYSKTQSFCETYEILIKLIEEGVKQLNTKVFAIQTLIKNQEYDTGPNFL